MGCKDKEQYDSTKEVGKLVAKVERFVPKESMIYGVYAGLSEKEILGNVKG